MKFLTLIATTLSFLFLFNVKAFAQDFLITKYGAKPDTTILNTVSINKAIQTCHAAGGGRVVIPRGTFKSGTITMLDNVHLYFEHGATLLGSEDYRDFPAQKLADYRFMRDERGLYSLIYAEGASNIAITGHGTIDGNGEHQVRDPLNLGNGADRRSKNLLFISCRNIRVEGITFLASATWNQHYLNCEDVIIDRVTVYNHVNRNNDAVDIDGSRRVVISNSIFDTDDDGITLKSTGSAPTEDVSISNCIVSSFCNAIKAGTESYGGFRNISISNCVIKPSRSKSKPFFDVPRIGITGISLEIVDGGVMEGVTISNVSIEGTSCPLYIRLGNRARKYTEGADIQDPGTLRNVMISNLTAYNTGNFTSSITGIPGHYVENISLSNVQFHNTGGLKTGDYLASFADVKEEEKSYPQPTVWGNLPASGLFIRHARNIQVNGLVLSSAKPDPRVPVIAVDTDGLLIKNIIKRDETAAASFFSGEGVTNYEVDKPLGWQKKVVELNP
ncbi:MAG: glycosyl hydrolase family 28 protein [Cyclobacteriaceae bacterium]